MTKATATTRKPAKQKRMELHGVKGMKSTPWRKIFSSPAELEKWSRKQDGDVEILGMREVD